MVWKRGTLASSRSPFHCYSHMLTFALLRQSPPCPRECPLAHAKVHLPPLVRPYTATFKCSPSRSCGCRHHALGNAPWRCWPGLQATVATHVWTYSTVGHKNPETRSCMGNWNSLTRQVDLPFSLSRQVDLRTHFSTSPPRQVFVNSTTLLEFSSEKMGGVVVDKTFLTTKCILPDLTLVYLCFLFHIHRFQVFADKQSKQKSFSLAYFVFSLPTVRILFRY